MFGIGLEIQRQAAIRRGEPWPGRYPWRALILIFDGLLNYIFIFEFDVLMGYGLTALVVAAVMARSPRAQKIWMGVGLAAHAVMMFFMAGGPRLFGSFPGGDFVREATPGEEGMRFIQEGLPTDSYWGMVTDRVQNFIGGRGEIPIMFFMGLGLFLVGAHLYRAGLFLPEGVRLRRIVMGIGFGVGFPSTGHCASPTPPATSPATAPPPSSPSDSSPPSRPSTPAGSAWASWGTCCPWSGGWP
ncbi:hypothetical protein B842_11175 [Corynebacterium humireducens NBRC 106098 = DSM 45392]|uniref:Uncharacterized protein n=1 Tax=Corynebacterium humireducens NBRC 106098 = DSM 45392 TaxID=1223515 RepID=A0A0B5DAU0_9CORY|nr:hypothetical protein [Corynebacterium humireducens]AJE34082.1 hypothetical protein B842_11175 [Corynebacterium humireducens NBRC 106098 = DSM 45392]